MKISFVKSEPARRSTPEGLSDSESDSSNTSEAREILETADQFMCGFDDGSQHLSLKVQPLLEKYDPLSLGQMRVFVPSLESTHGSNQVVFARWANFASRQLEQSLKRGDSFSSVLKQAGNMRERIAALNEDHSHFGRMRRLEEALETPIAGDYAAFENYVREHYTPEQLQEGVTTPVSTPDGSRVLEGTAILPKENTFFLGGALKLVLFGRMRNRVSWKVFVTWQES